MLRRPPISTLFPTRRSSDLPVRQRTPRPAGGCLMPILSYLKALGRALGDELAARSEEHTSELQSLRHLVCRLLLEKKNQHTLYRRPDAKRPKRAVLCANAFR